MKYTLRNLLERDPGLTEGEKKALQAVTGLLDCPEDMITEAIREEIREFIFGFDRDLLQYENILNRAEEAFGVTTETSGLISRIEKETDSFLDEWLEENRETLRKDGYYDEERIA